MPPEAATQEPAAGVVPPPNVDLSSEPVRAAVAAAVAEVETRAQERERGLKANHDRILEEKKKILEKIGGKPEDIAARMQRLEELENQVAADKAGTDPEKFRNEVDKAAQVKYETRKRELEESMTARDRQITELQADLQNTKDQIHRSFVAKEFVLAAMPEDSRLVQEGAWDYLVDQLTKCVVPHEIPGAPFPASRFKINGSLVPGGGPDKLMTMREFIQVTRLGKGPLPHLAFCFVSGGTGTGTSTPGRTTGGGKDNWWKMDADERAAFVRENGAGAAKDLMDRSQPPSAG